MILYHGSPNKFSKFDYSRIRTNGTTEGAGFYFTDSRRIAEGYAAGGYLYTVLLKGEKPLYNDRKTLTWDEVKRLLVELEKCYSYLENYGEVAYEGYDTVLERALKTEYEYSDTDTDILGSIYNACGENGGVLELFYNVLGYDYIVADPEWGGDQTVYVALTNDIISIREVEEM